MPEISFGQAQRALSHLQKRQLPGGQTQKPPLIELKGKDRALKIYQLKKDIHTAFDTHIERFDDLSKEWMELNQQKQKAEVPKKVEALQTKLDEINDEVAELNKETVSFELNAGQLTPDEVEEVLDAELIEDLDFAISLNGKA